MAILEETVIINLRGNTVVYYENLGYLIPRKINKKGKLKLPFDATLEVKVIDLPPRSEARVTKICDYCGKHIENQLYKDITTYREKTNGLDCCQTCKHIKRIENYELQPIPKGDSLAEKFPEIALEWSNTLNENTPSDVRAFSHKSVWWICPNDKSHVYESPINNRTNVNSGCPYCWGNKVNKSNCLSATYPEVAKEWHPTLNKEVTPDDVVAGSNKLFWWKCLTNPKHIWRTSVNNRTGVHLTRCPRCVREDLRGENNNNWKGGVTVLNQYLRSQTFDWVADCLKRSGYKCFISGVNRELEVHHVKPFHEIRDDVIEELDFPIYQTMGEYSQDQLNKFSDLIKEKHDTTAGIVMNKYLHDLFHSIYGQGINRKIGIDEVIEFKADYLSGKYSEIIHIG